MERETDTDTSPRYRIDRTKAFDAGLIHFVLFDRADGREGKVIVVEPYDSRDEWLIGLHGSNDRGAEAFVDEATAKWHYERAWPLAMARRGFTVVCPDAGSPQVIDWECFDCLLEDDLESVASAMQFFGGFGLLRGAVGISLGGNRAIDLAADLGVRCYAASPQLYVTDVTHATLVRDYPTLLREVRSLECVWGSPPGEYVEPRVELVEAAGGQARILPVGHEIDLADLGGWIDR